LVEKYFKQIEYAYDNRLLSLMGFWTSGLLLSEGGYPKEEKGGEAENIKNDALE
jgi:hypothetical protein